MPAEATPCNCLVGYTPSLWSTLYLMFPGGLEFQADRQTPPLARSKPIHPRQAGILITLGPARSSRPKDMAPTHLEFRFSLWNKEPIVRQGDPQTTARWVPASGRAMIDHDKRQATYHH